MNHPVLNINKNGFVYFSFKIGYSVGTLSTVSVTKQQNFSSLWDAGKQ